MTNRWLRHVGLVAVFWLISLLAIIVMWNSLPSVAAQVGVVLLLVVIIAASWQKFMELPLVASVFFSILLINDWSVTKHLPPLDSTVIIFLLLPAIGLLSEIIGYEELQIRRAHWALLGLLVAEANSVFYYWPVSFYNRSLMTGIVFYALWQLLRINEHRAQTSYVAHLVFISLSVIVVIGLIIWANFPQLLTF